MSNDGVPVDNFGTVVGKNPIPYGILALWPVNGLSIVYWGVKIKNTRILILSADALQLIFAIGFAWGLSTTHFALQYMENMPAFPPHTISLWFSFSSEK